MARRDVILGQQYRRVAGSLQPSVWQVSRIFKDRGGVPHSVVVNVADMTNKKTLASSILLDRRVYELVPADVAES